jgi:hypothetical protein
MNHPHQPSGAVQAQIDAVRLSAQVRSLRGQMRVLAGLIQSMSAIVQTIHDDEHSAHGEPAIGHLLSQADTAVRVVLAPKNHVPHALATFFGSAFAGPGEVTIPCLLTPAREMDFLGESQAAPMRHARNAEESDRMLDGLPRHTGPAPVPPPPPTERRPLDGWHEHHCVP